METGKQKRNKKKNKKNEVEIDEDELLDQLINENRSIVASSSNGNDETATSILKIDPRQLDTDAEIRNIMEKNMVVCGGGSKKIVKQQRNQRTVGRVIKMKAGWPPIKNSGKSNANFKL